MAQRRGVAGRGGAPGRGVVLVEGRQVLLGPGDGRQRRDAEGEHEGDPLHGVRDVALVEQDLAVTKDGGTDPSRSRCPGPAAPAPGLHRP